MLLFALDVTISPEVTAAYNVLYETVDQHLQKSAYCTITMAKLFANMVPKCSITSSAKVAQPVSVQVAATLDDI